MRTRSVHIPCIVLLCVSGCSRFRHERAPVERNQRHDAHTATHQITDVPAGIQMERVRTHIQVLAHDDLEGRGTGSRGIDIAAGYIAGQFAALGVEPGGKDGSYFQNFIIPGDPEIGDQTRLTVSGQDPLTLRTDFVPLGASGEGAFDGELVFVGYAIVDPTANQDDFEGLDVDGKVAVAFRGQPPSSSDQRAPRERALFDRKIKSASERGAKAIWIVNQAPADGQTDELLPFSGRRGRSGTLPAMHVRRAIVDDLLAAARQPTLADLQKALDGGGKVSVELGGVRALGAVELKSESLPSRNVIGLVPGNGPDADQVVVIGAHYDHLGVRDGQIYNGADDNASGTAGVIEACGAIAKMPSRNRTLLCMTFTGEEIGLLGSEHFVESPTVPMNKIVAMLNMDMIGRWTPNAEANELAVQGLGTGDSFPQIIEKRTREAGIKPIPDPSAKGPSDHAPFYGANVPALFFFTGIHSDYHRPGDDIEKVNFDGVAQITTLVTRITYDLINASTPPVFAKVDAPANIFRGPRPSPVVMGIMPGQSEDSPQAGWPIADVVDGGGAAKAGMRPGDRILSVDGHAISSLADYYKATEKKKAGDIVPVVVRRGSDEITLQVELAARP